MAEIILDLGPLNAVDDIAVEEAVAQLAQWQERRGGQGWRDRDAPDLMIRTVCDAAGTLRKSVIFQKQEWASAFLGFWNGNSATG